MDDNTLRLILAAALTPIFVGGVRWLTEPLLRRLAEKNALRDRLRQQKRTVRAQRLGRQLASWVRRWRTHD